MENMIREANGYLRETVGAISNPKERRISVFKKITTQYVCCSASVF